MFPVFLFLIVLISIPMAHGAPSDEPSSGSGVVGHYFADRSYQSLKKIRQDQTPDLTWKSPVVAPTNGKDFWIEWEGQINILKTGDYEFQLEGDADGFVYIDGKQVFQRWQDTPPSSLKIKLETGAHRLRVGAISDKPTGKVSLQEKGEEDPGFRSIAAEFLTHTQSQEQWKRIPRQAAQVGLEWLQSAAVRWQNNKGCFGCHVQSQVLMGMSIAKKNRYLVSDDYYDQIYEFIKKKQNDDGSYDPYSKITATQFATMGLAYADDLKGVKPNPVFVKAIDYLLTRQKTNGEFPMDHNEPPIDQGSLMNTANAVVALNRAYEETGQMRYREAAAKGIEWIRTTPEVKTTQDKIFRILTLTLYGNSDQKKALPELLNKLKSEQKPDGGWAETPQMKGSNSFATGQVIYALNKAGVSLDDPEFTRGVRFLLEKQQVTGAWPADNTQTRRPSEFAPTMWAVIGLAGAFDVTEEEKGPGTLKVQLQNLDVPTSEQMASFPPDNIEIILDMSGSMWEQIQGKAKVEIAREVMASTIRSLPKNANVGIRVYGHRSKSDCKDTELLVPFGKVDTESAIAKINVLKPKGMTPIDNNLREALKDVNSLQGSKVIILVTDGIESCKGNPVKAAQDLMAAGLKTKIHVVGFNLSHSPEAVAQLKKVAEVGQGKLFMADSATELNQALSEAVKVTYSVFDNQNRLVYSKPLGLEPNELPSGTYRIEVPLDPPLVLNAVKIEKGKTTLVNIIKQQQRFRIE